MPKWGEMGELEFPNNLNPLLRNTNGKLIINLVISIIVEIIWKFKAHIDIYKIILCDSTYIFRYDIIT